MRLRLDIFNETLVLKVEQEVSPRGVLVLDAGFKKLIRTTEVQWIFVDFSKAHMPPESVELAKKTAVERDDAQIQRLFLVGNIAGVCAYIDMDQALKECPAPEAKRLVIKLQYEEQIRELKAALAELAAAIQANPAAQSVEQMKQENLKLRTVLAIMEKEVSEASKQPDPKLIKAATPKLLAELQLVELQLVKDEILGILKELGVL